MIENPIGVLIAGQWQKPTATYEITDPFDGSVIANVQDADAKTAAQAVDAAAEAAPDWQRVSLERRKRILEVAADELVSRRKRLIEMAIADTGARRTVAETMQVDAAIARLRSWAAQGEDLLIPKPPTPVNQLGVSLHRKPVGVVACISPYNFPLLAMVGKVAPALFSGNTVVMKPAPQDPLLVAELADALNAAVRSEGGPDGAVNFVVGSTAESGAALVDHPAVGAVSFTGSTTVGIEIYRAAAPGMKRLLLELGGKGALIVRDDADIDAVLAAVTRTWTYHSGQVCLTPSRLLASGAMHDALVSALQERLKTLRHGDPRDPETEVAPIITAVQRDRIASLVQSTRDEGLSIATSTGLPKSGFHHPATLVTGANEDSTIMREEAFGPVVAVMKVRDDAHAIAVANSTRYGLYDYVYSGDSAAARNIASQLDAAQVGINTVARHPGAPFGGNKLSGLGRTGGTYALDVYTDLQALVESEK